MDSQPDFLALRSKWPLRLHDPLTAGHDDADRYRPPEGLKEAVDVAMMLGEPLVLTGAPGSGKTQSAKWLAQVLGAEKLLRFDVKSTTLGIDLLYAFDDVARFRDSAASGRDAEAESKPLVRYLRFNALGEGILRAAGPDSVLLTAAGEELDGRAIIAKYRDLLDAAFGRGWSLDRETVRVADLLPDEISLRMPDDDGRQVRVVLIDELDKAPRDTPNDLLVEVETMTFLIAELGLRVKTDRSVRPVVIITTNAEKPLPEPFLRRCAFFDVPPVRGEALVAVLKGALRHREASAAFADEIASVAQLLHDSDDALRRKPGTAEILAWSEVLMRFGASGGLREWASAGPTWLGHSLTALLKHPADQKTGQTIILKWASGDQRARNG